MTGELNSSDFKDKLKGLETKFDGKDPEDIIGYFLDLFGDKLVFASSLSAEDQVLSHIALMINPKVRIFVLDTGRLNQETYDVMAKTMSKYNMRYEVYFPDSLSVEKMVRQNGPNLFYDSIENRKMCCNIRKVEPLKRVLETCYAWITGIRRDQSVTRKDAKEIEWDDSFDILKINPLVRWTEKQVWEYIKIHNIPYNVLHDQGYPSIGCAPCTRAIEPGEDLRSGRWWWENPDQKECGLHMVDGKLVRKPKPE